MSRILVGLVALSVAVPVASHASVALRGIHTSGGSGYTRVVLDLSSSTRAQYGYVPSDARTGKPARFYVDLHDVVLERPEGTVMTVNDPRVTRVRTGQYQEKVTRVVLELQGKVTPKLLHLQTPPRVVIDLTGPGLEAAPPLIAQAPQPKPAVATQPNSATATSSLPAAGGVKLTPAPAAQAGGAPNPSPSNGQRIASAQPQSTQLPVSAGRGTKLQPVAPAPASGQAQPSRASGSAEAVSAASSPRVQSAAVRRPAAAPAPGAPVHLPVSAGRGTALQALPPKAGSATAAGKATPARSRPVRIVLDPGHGGKDPGAQGPGGVEKESVLDISKRVAAKLKKNLAVEVFMTRTDDTYVALDKRKDIANSLEADLFVSIHANASRNNKTFGIETYYLKNTNDRATLRLAKLENGVDMLIKGTDVSTDADLNYILSDIIQGQKESDSVLLANHVQTQLCGHLNTQYDAIHSLGVKQGPFFVLDGTYMPAILVETGFITNSHEGRRLRGAGYRDMIAEGIYRGIKAYLEDARVNDLT